LGCSQWLTLTQLPFLPHQTDSVLFQQPHNPSTSSLPLSSSSRLQPSQPGIGGGPHHSASSASLALAADRKGKARASPLGTPATASGRGSSDFLALDMDGDGGENGLGLGSKSGGGGYQQMQLMEQQVREGVFSLWGRLSLPRAQLVYAATPRRHRTHTSNPDRRPSNRSNLPSPS
jgi:syntaxin 5